ncbi:MAG: PQQ-like beta-propeller repeat protein [Aureliella sp.]
MNKLSRFLLPVVICAAISNAASAQDWPTWQGPTRDGMVPSGNGSSKIGEAGLSLKWSAPVGLGYSGPVIAGKRVFVTDYQLVSGKINNLAGKRDELQGKERVICVDFETGQKLWEHAYDRPYSVSYPGGPRATPTVYNNRLYTLGSEGDLLCLSVEDGELLWQVSFNDDFGAQTPFWGHAASPLVYGDQLICMVGGPGSLVVALDLETGEAKWKSLSSKDNETGYCPPSIVNAGGVDQLIVWDPTTISSLNPTTGTVYWDEDVAPGYGMSILPPVSDGRLLFVSGESQTSALFRLADDKPAAELLWRGKPATSLYLATSAAIFDGNHIYGADIRSGAVVCFETETGQRNWQSALPTTGSRRGRGGAHGSAFMLKFDDGYLILSETGDLISAELTPEGYQETGRFHAIDTTNKSMGRDVLWTYPAVAHGRVFVRNDKELRCFELSK